MTKHRNVRKNGGTRPAVKRPCARTHECFGVSAFRRFGVLGAFTIVCLLTGCGEASPKAAADAPGHAAPARPADSARPAAAVDAEYAKLLGEIVDDDGLVRYDLLADDSHSATLRGVIERLASAPLPTDNVRRLALWCNAYNANALAMTLHESRQPDFKTVNDVPGFFDQKSITVAGESMTLNGLEEMIRKMGDPRIHAALVCGAFSCPPLRAQPYAADLLDEQLKDQCRRWLDDQAKNSAYPDWLMLSELFKWYEDDFKVEPYGDRIGFVQKLNRPGGMLRAHIRHAKNVEIHWAPFDWRLNRAPTAVAPADPPLDNPPASAPHVGGGGASSE